MEKGSLKPEDVEPDIGPFYWYFSVYKELSTCRQIGMGLGPIPFTAIVEYSRIYEVDDFEDFLYIIRRMDDKFIELESKKGSNGSSNTAKKDNSRGKNSRGAKP